ncbi:MAG: hypothetical protein F7B20_00950 [Aeropyrum sp.]|nr:hypothetical protein [Aeropyrum sp.]
MAVTGEALTSRVVMVGTNINFARREVLSRLEGKWEDILRDLGFRSRGVVVLATCNRFEAYFDEPPKSLLAHVASMIASTAGGRGAVVELRGIDAIRHLFRVAAGLESRIIGDHEVLGQVRLAWLKARELGFTTPLLDEVFHKALRAGSRVRSETGISRGGVGYIGAAVQLSERVLGSLEGLKIGVVGAGMAARSIANLLCMKSKPSLLLVFNRTVSRGREVLALCGGVDGEVLPLDALRELVRRIDVLYVAVGGGHLVLSEEDLEGNTPKIVIDVSNPPATPRVEGRVFHMKHLEEEARRALRERLKWLPAAESIIESELKDLLELLAKRPGREASRSVARLLSRLSQRELARATSSLKREVPPDEVLEMAMNAYTKKVVRALQRLFEEASLKGSVTLDEVEEILVGELSRLIRD